MAPVLALLFVAVAFLAGAFLVAVVLVLVAVFFAAAGFLVAVLVVLVAFFAAGALVAFGFASALLAGAASFTVPEGPGGGSEVS